MPNRGFPQTEDDPVICINWHEAKAYADWSAAQTGCSYRLLSEAEWVEDCYWETYAGALTDGSIWREGDGTYRVARGGSWTGNPFLLRAAERGRALADSRNTPLGFRVARSLQKSRSAGHRTITRA